MQGHPRNSGVRGRTRSKFKKTGPKASVNDLLQDFAEGDVVQIVIEPSIHAGLPFRSYHGLTGKISAKRGKSFEVKLKRGNVDKVIVTTAAHLKKLKMDAKTVEVNEAA